MSTTTETHDESRSQVHLNPWLFVPLLYFLQAIPVTLVQEVATVVYKDFGIQNEAITRWTSIIALPWSLQMLLGPLVDLTGTRRKWVMWCQAAITVALMIAPFALHLPAAFELSLGAFFIAAIFSALCNAAMDGFYLLAMPTKTVQAKFAGVQTTCYRLGTLFAKGLLVFVAGLLMSFPSLEVHPSAGVLHLTKDKKPLTATEAKLKITAGGLTDDNGNAVDPPISVSPDVSRLSLAADGTVSGNGQALGKLQLDSGATLQPGEVASKFSRRTAWAVVLFAGALIYGLLYLLERRTTPHPATDVEAAGCAELSRNVQRTLTVVGLGLSGYFVANAFVRLGAHAIWAIRDGSPTGPLKGWMLPPNPTILGVPLSGSGPVGELIQGLLAGVVFAVCLVLARRSIRGTAMGDAFASFFRQSGIVPILAFLMLYRFGEAMVVKISPLFLKDAPDKGGLGLSTEMVGTIKGIVGVFGIVIGGLAGGWVVSKFGLRKSILGIAVCMHLPNLLYLWASIAHPPVAAMYGVDFVEQFGYGFGFAGYTIFLQRVAQRGEFRTAHYALGVGIGALFIQVAGILSGIIQTNFGYPIFFTSALLFGIPGLLTLLFIPMAEEA